MDEFEYLKIQLEEIKRVTSNFSSRIIGSGGFGKVYEGIASHSKGRSMVAIKRLDRKFGQGDPEFWKEIMMLSRYRHTNLISLLGFCDEDGEKILVYEHACNGSLDRHLSSKSLTWAQRIKICLDAAKGLSYLHDYKGTQQRVLHRDIKSANILLDHNWNAKLSDMGLSRLGPANQSHTLMFTNVVGTPGYCDPQYMMTYTLTKESDIYSFGVVLFEVLCGRLCFELDSNRKLSVLVSTWKESYKHKNIDKIIFKGLTTPIDNTCLETFADIAFQCIHESREQRPKLSLVVEKLENALKLQERYEEIIKGVETRPRHRYLEDLISHDNLFLLNLGKEAESGYGRSQHVPFKTSNAPLQVLLLHGNLNILVKEAQNLPNMDMFHNMLGQVFGILPTFGGGKDKSMDGKPVKVTSDPYVTVSIADVVIARTFVISNSENPVWMQHFYVPVAHYSAEVQFVVKDSDIVGSQIMGAVGIPVEQLVSGSLVEGTFPVLNKSGKPCKRGAVLTLSIQYTPMEKVPLDPNFKGVPGTYFPLRRGGKVTLYQDAHVDDGVLPNIQLDGGIKYKNGHCWHDICEAIKQARRLIYITGWSVVHSVQLVRNGEGAKDTILGDLLKAKSSEGVRVLLLVWDDPTSRSILGIKTQGVMGTNDEETRRFFKHSSVKVLLCPRSAGKGYSWAKKQEAETIYTHHQKTVIVDADAGNSRRRLMAFVGGLDLGSGRYDTPSHPIFSTLQTLHKDDYHQPNYTGPTTGCPREPWHDLHSRIEGLAAYDVLKNFEERWLRASKPHGIHKMKKSVDDSLLKLERMPDILGIDEAHCTDEQDPEGWHVQVFRSIDSNSVKGFPKDPKDATSKNLVCGKNVLIDMSIHTAYVKAIRAAQHFIYIENQYFLGSSFNWSSHKTLGANNLIPMEIALKIANKIRANERFAAYIVIPMWPEGSPTTTPIQRILYWLNKTMQMMYEVIYKALHEVGLENVYEPQDYLVFFCLGTRESSHGEEPFSDEKGSNATITPQSLSRKTRRFMIYVHSKGMIVDDEFVILGSANINQRSLEGSRDTEIAMGAYQPYHTWANKRSSPHGQIFGYRMSLWAEHIGGLESSFEIPESLECVRRVRSLSEMNWNQYAAVEVTDMKAHLLKYPVEVDRTGQVKPLPNCPNFPDLGGNIVGTFVAIQENLTI